MIDLLKSCAVTLVFNGGVSPFPFYALSMKNWQLPV